MKIHLAFTISLFISIQIVAQNTPVLKKQISLTEINNVLNNSNQNTFLVSGNDNYTLIEQASKIQLGTLQVDVGSYSLPGHKQTYLWNNNSFIISEGRTLLLVDILKKSIDTIFNELKFPEFIIQYSPIPWNDETLLIVTKIYPVSKTGNVQFSKTDKNNQTVYDDTKNCRLLLYNIKSKKVIKQVSINFAITCFSNQNNKLLAGSFDGNIYNIDSTLNTQLIFQPFKVPVHSVLLQNNFIVTIPHIAPKFIGDEADGTVIIYNTETKKSTTFNLPLDSPVVESRWEMNPDPSNQIKKIFSLPKQHTLLINYGFRQLLNLNLVTNDTVSYPINKNAVSFYCFNRDSSLLLAATQEKADIFGVTGDIALYSLNKKSFQPSFNKPLEQKEWTRLYKFFDDEGNYHFLTYKSDYSNKDSITIFSSNKTEPIYLASKNCKFNVNERDQTITLNSANRSVIGKIDFNKLWNNSYRFNLGYRYNEDDSLHTDIFNVIQDLRRKPNKDFAYQTTEVHLIANKQLLVAGYKPATTGSSLYNFVLVDSNNTTIFKLEGIDNASIFTTLQIDASKKYIAYYAKTKGDNTLFVWNLETQKQVYSKAFADKKPLSHFSFDRTKNILWFTEEEFGSNNHLYKINLSNNNPLPQKVLSNPSIFGFAIDEEKDLLAFETYSEMTLMKLSTQKILWRDKPLESSIKISYQPNGIAFGTKSEFYTIANNLNNCYFTTYTGNKPVEILNNHLYKADKSAINNLAFVLKEKGFLPEDFDMYFNRPDSVTFEAGSTNATYNELLSKVVEKRKRKFNTQNITEVLSNSPTCTIINKNEIPDVTKENHILLQIKASSPTSAAITAIHIINNGVPVFGKAGFTNNNQPITEEQKIDVVLTNGINNVQVYVSDNTALVSASESIIISSDYIEVTEPKQHFIGIGINQYANPDYNLNWSVKDIRDLALKLKSKYPNIIIDTLFDENVTKEKILEVKKKLLQLNENDKVIVSYSGHGVLNKDFDYFLSTYSINFEKPEEKGLSYNDLENLLDSIKPRQKLMFIDACHSGEVDKEEIEKVEAFKKELEKNGVVTKSTIKVKPKKNIGMANSFELMQNLFVNVGKGTGATIISAAGGMQYAQERGDLKNGVFTYSVLEAFDKNTTLKVSELKKIVGERVIQLTNGLQKPTSRNEANNYDWVVW